MCILMMDVCTPLNETVYRRRILRARCGDVGARVRRPDALRLLLRLREAEGAGKGFSRVTVYCIHTLFIPLRRPVSIYMFS